MKLFYFVLLSCLSLLCVACDGEPNFAPVAEASTIDPIPKGGIHRVTHGETLYEIAWRYGMDYRDLAKRNGMHSPYVLYTGEVIYLRGHPPLTLTKVENKPLQKPLQKQEKPEKPLVVKQPPRTMKEKEIEPHFSSAKWLWPAQGKIINYFSGMNKGVNIAGTLGEPIYAAGSGKVVYAGDGLRGYGNLIILKHNSVYLSAYAYNSRVFVKEGDWVKQGEKMAEMGKGGAGKAMLHFEIRRAGKPINPISLYRKNL